MRAQLDLLCRFRKQFDDQTSDADPIKLNTFTSIGGNLEK
jgi:hypothetical protein|tara:strand:+ start:1520 stop:1639 length:120 start_codon:yes stop_codon:yes gene_type:complete